MAKKRRGKSRYLPVRVTPREDWGIALEVAGVVQSVSVPDDEEAGKRDASLAAHGEEPQPGPGGGYWGLMLPPGCPRRALLLGLGGGTVASLLARRCPDAEIVGVDNDPEVLAVSRSDFGLDELPHLRVELADAFAWVAEHVASEPGTFDLICLDLFQAGRLTLGALATPFLRQVAVLLAPGGMVTVNLMVTARTTDQVHRLERVFTPRRELRLRGNLVVHAMSREEEPEKEQTELSGSKAEQAARSKRHNQEG
ncbi:MAG: methyltransferase domain-containing protein [Ktedonobacterales bacterium]